jgi:hypothetical protein
MVKSDVDFRTDSKESLEKLLQEWWPACQLREHSVLRGGFSGTNYKVTAYDGRTAVLKICNGYTSPEVEQQALCTDYLMRHGFQSSCCYSLPFANIDDNKGSNSLLRFVAVHPDDGVPATFLNFVQGRAADYVLENASTSTSTSASGSERVLNKATILNVFGEKLSALHSIPLITGDAEKLRSFLDGGACLIGQHVKRTFLESFEASSDDFIRSHPYVDFYRERIEALIKDASDGRLTMGILHGDPFMDNILIDEITGEFR